MFKAEKIRVLCKAKKITLTALAENVGMTNTGIQGILNNNVTTTSNLEKICNVLGVSPNYFFEYDENTNTGSVHLNMGNGNIQHAVGNVRGNMSIVSDNGANSESNDIRLKELENENEHSKQKLVDKEAIIAMQNDFIQNLKRQIR